MTIDNLFKQLNNKDFNEEAAFILAQTNMGYHYGLSTMDKEAIIALVFRFNPQRWCKWVNNNFQSLRYDKVKEIYCEKCEGKLLFLNS